MASTLAGHAATPALIAMHHLAARDFEPARQALLEAAGEHYAVHAYRDAARALRTALEHWPPDEQDGTRLPVIDRLARCAEMCSEYVEAVSVLPEPADRDQPPGRPRPPARRPPRAGPGAHTRLARAQELRGQWESALAAREAAAIAYSAAGPPAEAVIDRLAMAAHLRSAASYSAALAALSAAEADAEASARADLLLRV